MRKKRIGIFQHLELCHKQIQIVMNGNNAALPENAKYKRRKQDKACRRHDQHGEQCQEDADKGLPVGIALYLLDTEIDQNPRPRHHDKVQHADQEAFIVGKYMAQRKCRGLQEQIWHEAVYKSAVILLQGGLSVPDGTDHMVADHEQNHDPQGADHVPSDVILPVRHCLEEKAAAVFACHEQQEEQQIYRCGRGHGHLSLMLDAVESIRRVLDHIAQKSKFPYASGTAQKAQACANPADNRNPVSPSAPYFSQTDKPKQDPEHCHNMVPQPPVADLPECAGVGISRSAQPGRLHGASVVLQLVLGLGNAPVGIVKQAVLP